MLNSPSFSNLPFPNENYRVGKPFSTDSITAVDGVKKGNEKETKKSLKRRFFSETLIRNYARINSPLSLGNVELNENSKFHKITEIDS